MNKDDTAAAASAQVQPVKKREPVCPANFPSRHWNRLSMAERVQVLRDAATDGYCVDYGDYGGTD